MLLLGFNLQTKQVLHMIKMLTNLGTIEIELFEKEAPLTCANFIQYINDGFYNGTIFHRVIPNFMIQCGGFEPGMEQKATKDTIKNEADNGLKNDNGTLAMARRPDPDSASSQFFINTKDNDFLNFKNATPDGYDYCVFGKVVNGMDVVEKIEKAQTSRAGMHQDVPVEDIIIESMTIA